MAKEFGKDKFIIGWQIDNEMYPNDCRCPICTKKFQNWLKEKYVTIENLNKSWGMERWSLFFTSFDSVILPDAGWNHPSLSSAWDHFMSDSVVEFSNEQVDIIRQYSNAPVGTDMMPLPDLSFYDTAKKLDILQFNHYQGEGELYKAAFWFDYIRAIKNLPYWLTETAIGWNGATQASDCRPINFCYANSWLSYAAGGEMNLYWHWRAHKNGHELGHGAVLTSSGRKTFKTREIEKLAKELQKAADFLSDTEIKPQTALHYSYTASNILKHAPIIQGLNYLAQVRDSFYLPLACDNHINMDVIDHPHSVDGYNYIFSPFLCTLDNYDLRDRMLGWVKSGGTWIVGPSTDIMNAYSTKYIHAPFGILEDICGLFCAEQLPSANLSQSMVWYDGTTAEGGVCYDAFRIADEANVQSLITYDEGPFKGLSAATETTYGDGKIILLGTVLSRESIKKLIKYLNIETVKASENVHVINRTGKNTEGIIALELNGRNGYLQLDGEYIDLISGKKISGKMKLMPYDVKVLCKDN